MDSKRIEESEEELEAKRKLRNKQTVLSNDVSGLYVEVKPERAGEEVMKTIIASSKDIETDDEELAKFIACTTKPGEIEKLGLKDVIHTRKHMNGPRPGLKSIEMKSAGI